MSLETLRAALCFFSLSISNIIVTLTSLWRCIIQKAAEMLWSGSWAQRSRRLNSGGEKKWGCKLYETEWDLIFGRMMHRHIGFNPVYEWNECYVKYYFMLRPRRTMNSHGGQVSVSFAAEIFKIKSILISKTFKNKVVFALNYLNLCCLWHKTLPQFL